MLDKSKKITEPNIKFDSVTMVAGVGLEPTTFGL